MLDTARKHLWDHPGGGASKGAGSAAGGAAAEGLRAEGAGLGGGKKKKTREEKEDCRRKYTFSLGNAAKCLFMNK